MTFRNSFLIISMLVSLGISPASARDYYVDYENGDDSRDGRTPQTAWKHAPGDNLAPATASHQRLTLQPGDRLLFKGGVRYRRPIMPRGAGTVENPAVIDGSSWGPGRAIFDGSNLLPGARKCTSAAECFGNPNWKHLWRIPIPADARWTDWLFAGDRPLQPAQYPDLPLYRADDTSKYLVIPRDRTAALRAGAINHPLPAGFTKGSPVLGLWIQGNTIAFTDAITINTSGISIAGSGWINGWLNPYTDRDNRFTLLNVPDQVKRPGTYAVSVRDGFAIAWPWTPLATNFSIGGRREGINMGRLNHTEIRGFTFANYAARPAAYSTGIAILGSSSTQGNIISNNNLQSAVTFAHGRAYLTVVGSSTTIRNNVIQQLPWSSAIQIDGSSGPTVIQCNHIQDIGRTGIRLNNTANVTLKSNFITRLKNIHGNGITFYNDTRNATVVDNIVTKSDRPFTMNGNSTNYFSSGKKSIYVSRNIFSTDNPQSSALLSYGNTQNATLTDNFLSAPSKALDLRGTEVNFQAQGNTLVGTVLVHNKADIFDHSANIFQDPGGNGHLLTGSLPGDGLPELCNQ